MSKGFDFKIGDRVQDKLRDKGLGTIIGFRSTAIMPIEVKFDSCAYTIFRSARDLKFVASEDEPLPNPVNIAQRKEYYDEDEPFPGGDSVLAAAIDPTVKKDMKYDADKPRMDLLLSGCPLALEAISSILTFGAKKYSANSWQTVERGDERYLAALLRHLTAHAKGESTDPESGMSHLAHAACNAMFILELELKKNADAG